MTIYLIIEVIICGFFTAWFSKKLDDYLNYGEIFGGVRLKIVCWFAQRNGIDQSTILEYLDPIHYKGKEDPFLTRQETMAGIYSKIAFSVKWVKPFICVTCMSEYINTVLAFSYLILFTQYSILEGFTFVLLSSIMTYYFLIKSFK